MWEGKKRRLKDVGVNVSLPLSVFFEYVLFVCIYVCVYWRNNEDAMWSSQSLSWTCGLTYFISLIWKCVHTVSYVIHTVTPSICCLWRLVCRCEFVHISSSLLFPPPQRFLTVHDNMVPFSLTQPVIIVHRVNLALFYFAFCFSLFRTCQWTFLINFEAVAKCVSLNPTVDTQMPCVHASCAYVYIVCKPVNIFDICGCEWNEPMYTVL